MRINNDSERAAAECDAIAAKYRREAEAAGMGVNAALAHIQALTAAECAAAIRQRARRE